MNNKQKIRVTVWVIILLITGYFRDFLFVNINNQIDVVYYHYDQSNVSPWLKIIWGLSYEKLYWLKWILTLAFSAWYLGICLFVTKTVFNDKKYLSISVAVYLVLLLISFLFMITGYLFSSIAPKTYEFARYLMGFAQSPAILMILTPCFFALRYLKKVGQ